MNILKHKVTIQEIYDSFVQDKCLLCSESMEKEEQLKTEDKLMIPLCVNHRMDAIGQKLSDRNHAKQENQ